MGPELTPASAVNLPVRSLQWAGWAVPVVALVCQHSAHPTPAGPPSAPHPAFFSPSSAAAASPWVGHGPGSRVSTWPRAGGGALGTDARFKPVGCHPLNKQACLSLRFLSNVTVCAPLRVNAVLSQDGHWQWPLSWKVGWPGELRTSGAVPPTSLPTWTRPPPITYHMGRVMCLPASLAT